MHLALLGLAALGGLHIVRPSGPIGLPTWKSPTGGEHELTLNKSKASNAFSTARISSSGWAALFALQVPSVFQHGRGQLEET